MEQEVYLVIRDGVTGFQVMACRDNFIDAKDCALTFSLMGDAARYFVSQMLWEPDDDLRPINRNLFSR